MDKDTFNNLYMCTFKPDERVTMLQDRLYSYYKSSENLSDKCAMKEYKTLREFVRCSGYTEKEFSQAKRVVSGWKI